MNIVAFVSDLMFRSKIDGDARAAKAHVSHPKPEDPVDQAVADAELVFVDLALKGRDPFAVIADVRRVAPQAHIVAFGSHVDAKALAAAHEAGADEALPRSSFTRRLPEILRGGQYS